MSSVKKWVYDVEAEKNGETRTYHIFKKGGKFFIDEYPVPSESAIKRELQIVFGAKFLRKIQP